VRVSGLTNGIAVAGGIDHSLALKSDGSVWAWGAGYYGQLGNGTTGPETCAYSLPCSTTPVQVSNLTNVIAVAAGNYHSLALKSDGRATNHPPDVSQAYPSAATLWPPNHKFVPVTILGVTDPDNDPVTITITRIYQDEPVSGLGDGDATPDATGIGTAIAQLRAERSGKGNGRVYTIYFEARDDRGGVSSGFVTVGVPHDQGKVKIPMNDGPVFDSTQ
jgi:hypothetical protein